MLSVLGRTNDAAPQLVRVLFRPAATPLPGNPASHVPTTELSGRAETAHRYPGKHPQLMFPNKDFASRSNSVLCCTRWLQRFQPDNTTLKIEADPKVS